MKVENPPQYNRNALHGKQMSSACL